MLRRLGGPGSERSILITQGNLANTYQILGRLEEAGHTCRDIYRGCLKLNGEPLSEVHEDTLQIRNMILAANNYAYALVVTVRRFEEAKALMRKMMPVARRVLGNENILTLQSKMIYAEARARRRAAAERYYPDEAWNQRTESRGD